MWPRPTKNKMERWTACSRLSFHRTGFRVIHLFMMTNDDDDDDGDDHLFLWTMWIYPHSNVYILSTIIWLYSTLPPCCDYYAQYFLLLYSYCCCPPFVPILFCGSSDNVCVYYVLEACFMASHCSHLSLKSPLTSLVLLIAHHNEIFRILYFFIRKILWFMFFHMYMKFLP
jgi:hypothetical protein